MKILANNCCCCTEPKPVELQFIAENPEDAASLDALLQAIKIMLKAQGREFTELEVPGEPAERAEFQTETIH